MNATIKAVRELYPLRELVVCLEVGSDGEVPENFWKQYDDCMQLADDKYIYYSNQNESGRTTIDEKTVEKIFGSSKVKVVHTLEAIKSELYKISWKEKNLLLLRANNGASLDFSDLSNTILNINA